MAETAAPDPQEPNNDADPDVLDVSDFGFEDVCSVQLATLGLLNHFQRLGMSVLPLGVEPSTVVQRLAFPPREPLNEGTEATSGGVDVRKEAGGSAGQQQLSQQPSATPATSPPTSDEEPKDRAFGKSRIATPISLSSDAGYQLPVLSPEDRTASLATASQQVSQCRLCPQLVMGRRNTVYGEGSPNPRVCFFGEAPGAEEDQSGRPFVGKAGQLLTKMIQACTFAREDTYILNTVKCRPPGNRNPEQEELNNCQPFFEHQFEVLQPEYIVCLGLVAAKALLQTTLPVGRLRGAFHQYKGSKVVVTYHPAYLLRNPDAKRAAWDDLQMMLHDMGIDPKKR